MTSITPNNKTFFKQNRWFVVLLGLMLMVTSAQAQTPSDAYRRGVLLYKQGAYLTAIQHLRQARRLHPQSYSVRYYLARAYIGLGDRYGELGNVQRQRRLYQRALQEDPQLIDDPHFVARYRRIQVPFAPRPSLKRRPRPSPAFTPPRKRRLFGMGLTLGIEGLLGIQAGMMFFGHLNPTITFGPVLMTLDISLRYIALSSAWSPYVSIGYMFSLGQVFESSPPSNDNNSSPINANQINNMFHFGMGVNYMSKGGLSFSAGLSFVVTGYSDLAFVPIPTIQLAWYF